MISVSTFYLSRVLGKKVYSESNEVLGKIADILVYVKMGKPRVIALQIRKGSSLVNVDYACFTIRKTNGQYHFKCRDMTRTVSEHQENTLYLKSNVLDRQLVDINGHKLVRVNDLRLAVLSSGTFVIAVDVGLEGLLRRLGIAKPFKRLLKPFKVTLPSKLILWDEVETVDFGHAGIKLSTVYSKLETLHVSDLADIIEEMDSKIQTEVFSSLDEERAADVLEEMEIEAQVKLLGQMPIEKAADLLEKMPADEVADILEEIPDERAERLLSEMESLSSEEVRELMEYDEDEVGSLMTTDFLSFTKDMTVDETFAELRRIKPEPDEIYYLNLVDKFGRLIANASLRDIVISNPETKLSEIMNEKAIYVYDTDELDSVAEIISKYSLLAVPVVNKNMVLIGMVVIDDVVYTLLKSHKRRGL